MILFILILIILSIAYMYGLSLWFKKAGEESWKAYVPYYRISTWIKLTEKPKWYIWGSFIPVFNLFIYANLIGETSDTYRRHSWWEHTVAVLFGFVWLPYLGKKEDEVYHGPRGESGSYKIPKKTTVREWADAIIFAIAAAYIIRTFIFEIYAIPTSSMEGTLRIGDVLVVSKFHYGSRVPNTPIAFPLVHHSFPKFLGGAKSYLEWIKLPYKRLPKLETIDRNDMVVFNFPANDTTTKEFDSAFPYYDLVRSYQTWFGLSESGAKYRVKNGFSDMSLAVQNKVMSLIAGNFSHMFLYNSPEKVVKTGFTILARPVDKRENYIKRCVGISGDTLQVKDAELWINNKPAYKPENAQYEYIVHAKRALSPKDFIKLDVIENYELRDSIGNVVPNSYRVYISDKKALELKQNPDINSISKYIKNQESDYLGYQYTYYPYNEKFKWNVDNYGPIVIPQKGMTIPLNLENYLLYERCIRVYEGNNLEIKNGKAFINGVEALNYTFKMNYYWMMGDNRERSQDSRFWGFVPEDHVVGKAWFVVLSYSKENKFLRLNRFFKGIHGNWAPKEEAYKK